MQQAGGLGGSQTHYAAPEDMTTGAGAGASSSTMAGAAPEAGDHAQLVEAASPISSRPPASAAVNMDELMTLSGAAEDALGADRAGGGGSGGGAGGSGGNRWPRQETLALLKIRSDMDVVFRDATLKGPLWEDVSRKLAELGYRRSAKKCKEKFENVHKYYKRTKEGRAGRQDGKSYKFFTELEALHGTVTATGATAASTHVSAPPAVHVAHASPNPVSVGFSSPMPISSFRMSPTIPVMPSQQPANTFPVMPSSSTQPPPTATATATPMDINFSSNSSSSSPGTEDDDDDEDVEGEPSSSRKRKRGSGSTSSSGSGSTRKMMEFFEILMKRVMQKQEAMQQRFLEVIEKREQDRTIREEAWKRQEMARLTREHELMSQERAISASRDAAIISFLQKITGQTITLPPPVNVHSAPPPPVPPSVPIATPLATPPPQQQQQQQAQTYHQTPQQKQPQQQQQMQHARHTQQSQNVQVVTAVPEQQVSPPQQNIASGGGGSFEPSSSRWPKPEVLALIKLRSGLESRYQEAGPKGPLWEEISAGMGRMGYKRSSKRCKEKWENINKYFKKVKESNKKRPEDAKTCPYFHELDALYRKRILGGGSSGGGGGGGSSSSQQQQQPQQDNPNLVTVVQPSGAVVSQSEEAVVVATGQSENKNMDHSTNVESSNIGLRTNLFGEANDEAAKKPEDIVKELMEQQHHNVLQQGQQQLVVDDYDRIEEGDSDNIMDQEEDIDDEDIDEEDDEEMEEERKMAYKIEFQKQNTTAPSSNGGGNGAPSFLAMVQ